MLLVIDFLFTSLTSLWSLITTHWLLAFSFLLTLINLIITFYLNSTAKK